MTKITVRVKETAIVKPAEETPRGPVWLSNLDLMASGAHVPVVYLYRHGGSAFGAAVRDALARVLVPYYAVAGRMRFDHAGRLEIECCAEGVAFAEAEAECAVDELGDLTPTVELRKLAPVVDRSGGVSSFPLLAVQITRFKCGALSLGLAMEHRLADGICAINFVNKWSDLARGLDYTTLAPPSMDRSFLRARDPPQPRFDHTVEYQPIMIKPSRDQDTKTPQSSDHHDDNIDVRIFELREEQIEALKSPPNQYTTYEILTGHIWKCACEARGSSLPEDAETKLLIATDGRSRFSPPPPPNFFGNVIFAATPVAMVSDLVAKPTCYAASKVRGALARMKDEEYLRSAIDFLEQLRPSLSARDGRGSVVYNSPNFGVHTWARMPLYEADFGWGRPFYVGPAGISCEGKSFLLPTGDGSKGLFLAIALKPQDMAIFEKLIYAV